MRILGASVFDMECGFVERELNTDGELISAEPVGEAVDMSGMLLIPGLTDVHFHGCMGFDASDGELRGLSAIAGYELSRGVTQICPATMSLPRERLLRACEAAGEYSRLGGSGSELVGLNLEGPFLNEAKKGGHSAEFLSAPNIELFSELSEASGSIVKLVTVAPELDGGMEFIASASRSVRVSLGHTTADYDTARRAFDAGASQVTHIFNAMSPFLHRSPGVFGAAADAANVAVELICDGVHVHPSAVRAVFSVFGGERVILVSDSMRGTGLGDGEYDLGGQTVSVRAGRATLKDGSLAGSVCDLMTCMKRAVEFGVSPADAVRAAAVNPAKAVGIFDRCGSLDVGKLANIAVLDGKFELKHVIHKGKFVI